MRSDARHTDHDEETARQVESLSALFDSIMQTAVDDHESFKRSIRNILEFSAAWIAADKASLWRYDAETDAYRCLDLYRSSARGFESAQPLAAADLEQLVETLRRNSTIAASRAADLPELRALAKSRGLPPNTAILCASSSTAEGIRCFLCLEDASESRVWSRRQMARSGGLAKLLGVALDRSDRERLIRDLKNANSALDKNESFLSDIAAQVPGVIYQFCLDPDGRDYFTFMSAGCKELFGLEDHDIFEDSDRLWASIDQTQLPALMESIADSARNLTPWRYLTRITSMDGVEKWVQCQSLPTRLPSGTTQWNGLLLDVSDQIRDRNDLAEARRSAETMRRRLEEAIAALPDAFVIYDREDRLVTCNDQYRTLYERSAEAMTPGARFEDILRFGAERGQYPEAEGRIDRWIEERLSHHLSPAGPIEQELPDDRHLRIHESRTANGDTVGVRVDITELKRQQKRLTELTAALQSARSKAEHEALHDGLTDLPNRRHLDRELEALKSSAEETEPPHAEAHMLHVDLDRFKHINDTMGHAAGDAVLREVAARLRRTVRASDFVARVGGDEFVVLCQGVGDRRDVEIVASRLVDELNKPFKFGDVNCRISASIGLAASPAHCAEDLLVNADIALYRAKDDGRNRVVAFSADLQAELHERKRREDDILRGVEAGEFTAYFQPQFDAQTFECSGVEALARWRHPERGLLPPEEFLSLAEQTGVVEQIDRAVFEYASRECSALARSGLSIPKLAVNVSLPRLLSPTLPEEVRALRPAGMAVAFELLETVYFDDERSDVTAATKRLRAEGVGIEVDDFGSGRASVIGLLQIRPDCLKIDRRLIGPIVDNPRQFRLVSAIVDMGKSQGVKVAAEGVETDAHAAALRNMGCDILQGFFLAKPMTAAELAAFLQDRDWLRAEKDARGDASDARLALP